MNDDQLRGRIAATDPVLDGTAIDPVDGPSARTLLEAIMSTDTTTRTTTTRTATGSDNADATGTRISPRRRRWGVATLGAAAAAALAVAGAALFGVFDGEEPSLADPPVVDEPTVLELSAGETDPMMMSCIRPDASIVAQSPIAFRGIVESVAGDGGTAVVTLDVDRWYVGGDADVVTIAAPLGLEALIGSIDFVEGEPYLISAYDGVVSYCGLSGPATPELQQMYDAAFPG